MQAIWHNTTDIDLSSMPQELKPWVLYDGSMTARLKKRCDQFDIEVLKHDWAEADPQDLQLLKLENKKVIIRDVLIFCNKTPWIYARTIFPENLIKNMGDKIINLSDHPLGELLFAQDNVVRSEFELAELKNGDQFLENANEASKQKSSKMWARRSVFNLQQGSLLLTEVFLPQFLMGK